MGYLSVSTLAMNTQAPGLDWPYVSGSWNVIMDESGWNPSPEKDLLSTSPSPPDEGPGKRRILIVEDSKADIFLIREAIEKQGIDALIDVVRDGEAATRYLAAADADPTAPRPDLILLDMNLPKKSGGEVLRDLRASAQCRNTKVMIVTSSDAPQDRTSVGAYAVAGYFKKPSTYAEFMQLGPLVKALL